MEHPDDIDEACIGVVEAPVAAQVAPGDFLAPDNVIPGHPHLRPFVKGGDPRRSTNGGMAGPGRPPGLVRAASRLAYAQRIQVLEDIADGKPMPHERRIRLTGRGNISLPDGSKIGLAQAKELAGEGAEFLIVQWEESADIDQRIKAIHMLGHFGGMSSMAIPSDDAGGAMKNVYAIAFE